MWKKSYFGHRCGRLTCHRNFPTTRQLTVLLACLKQKFLKQFKKIFLLKHYLQCQKNNTFKIIDKSKDSTTYSYSKKIENTPLQKYII